MANQWEKWFQINLKINLRTRSAIIIVEKIKDKTMAIKTKTSGLNHHYWNPIKKQMAFLLRITPNVLTLLRISIVPIMILLWWLNYRFFDWINLALYTFACLSDYFDGLLARSYGKVSNFGRMLDPISDKLIVVTILTLTIADNTISGFNLLPALFIILREITVSGLREFLAEIRVAMPVSRLAKWKTAVQMFALGFLIIGIEEFYGLPVWVIGITLLWLASFLTIITGLDYLQKGLSYISLDPNNEHLTMPKKYLIKKISLSRRHRKK